MVDSKKTIRVLQINSGSKNFGGVSACLLNIYRNINRDRIQFDFLTPNITTYSSCAEEIYRMGGNIYQFYIDVGSIWGKVKLYEKLKAFLNEHEYDIIHINSGALLFNCVVVGTCKKYSKGIIITHSHNNGGRTKIIKIISGLLKRYLSSKSDALLACSKSAAEYMFTKQAVCKRTQIIKNGIDVDKYIYNPSARERLRKQYNLDGAYVIGNVGRFVPQKNHAFMIDVLEYVIRRNSKAKLMLVGEGEKEAEIFHMVQERNLQDHVLFMGSCANVNELYQAMDVFFLPSIFEGFGIVNIEAQVAGLSCVVSDAVPEEVDISQSVIHLSLQDSLDKWADCLLYAPNKIRQSHKNELIEAGYDIKTTAKQVENLYFSLWKDH